jgi:hypothetical protein
MNVRSDPDLAITAWLVDEARDGAPERLVESTRRELARTNQRRAVWPAWRLHPMNIRLAVVAAVIVIAVVGGFLILPKSTGPGSIATPVPTSTQTSPPSASPRDASTLTGGALEPGRYFFRPYDTTAPSLTVTFTVPSGWTAFGDWALLSSRGTTAPNGSGVGFMSASGLYSDPCHWNAAGTGNPFQGDITVGPSVADLVAALGAQAFLKPTAPVDVSVDGYFGKQLDIELPSDIDFATACDKATGTATGSYFVWATPEITSGNDLYAQGPGERRRLRILDVAGTRIIAMNNFYAGTAQADLDEAQAVIDSISITP